MTHLGLLEHINLLLEREEGCRVDSGRRRVSGERNLRRARRDLLRRARVLVVVAARRSRRVERHTPGPALLRRDSLALRRKKQATGPSADRDATDTSKLKTSSRLTLTFSSDSGVACLKCG